MNNFQELQLKAELLKALDAVGYESPSPIQARTIPLLLDGKDVVGQAQTGTGKTAAFALPMLQKIDVDRKETQILVLTPTRELAIQVAEAFQKYANFIKGFHVLPIYGGQDYGGQIRGLKRGAHVVVGTPGRVMDHMRKGTLMLNTLSGLVLDEADEMLRMGFIDDVEWILEQTPDNRQIALFSATMPKEIRRIAERHLNQPEQITIEVKTTTAETIRQRYWLVRGTHKLDALTRILEAETFEGMIIFVRTKNASTELSEKLSARGFASAPLNGDLSQAQREKTVDRLKSGGLDIVVATDVAARGLDVERISHVVNYDIPHDTESYVHRIGRTGRAGREGDAILFVAPREKRMLFAIEKATRKPIEKMELPSTKEINDMRVERFKQRITDTLFEDEYQKFTKMLTEYGEAHGREPIEIAAALAHMMHADEPLWMEELPEANFQKEMDGKRNGKSRGRSDNALPASESGMKRYRVGVGYKDRVKPGNIVGAIANEAGISSNLIGRIEIMEMFSLVDISDQVSIDQLMTAKDAWVAGRQLQLREWEERDESSSRGSRFSRDSKRGKKSFNRKKKYARA